ncbi:MAG: M48 family metalloprotease [Tahibacter sp.]
MKRLATASVLLALVLPVVAQGNDYYLVESIATQSRHAQLRAQARELTAIYRDMSRQAGIEAQLVYSTDPDINAFATEVGGEKIVVVQEGLLEIMGNDRDAVAAALGHELAHHKADHIRAGRRKQEGVRVLGTILGIVVAAKVGRSSGELAGAVAGTAVGVGAGLIALKFNRNQEMEADRLSLDWMIRAGYNPQGMLRLQRRLGELDGPHRAAIVSTHPPSAKRYQAAEKLIATLSPSPELLARAAAPLSNEKAVADAQSAIGEEEDQRVASLLKPGAEISGDALAPVDGVAFETYAAMGNELLFAGERGKSQVLAKHKLSDAKLARLSESYSVRMQQSEALSLRYSVDFFRATQGKFVAYGRDLADSFEKGLPLRLAPPYALETAITLHTAMRERGAPNLDFAQQSAAEETVLKPYGLSYYDFLIAHNWWSRKARIASLDGDSSLMERYLGVPASTGRAAAANAQAAGVRIGGNVKIGSNVHIGESNKTGIAPGNDAAKSSGD